MSPIEVFYGRECKITLNWIYGVGKQNFGPQIVQDGETHIRIIRGTL
jgi:hypothetical protein